MLRLTARLAAALLTLVASAALAAPPSAPTADAPQLARLGPYAVGVRRLEMTQPGQADLAHLDPATHAAPIVDRVLPVVLWYPAKAEPGARPVTYHASLPGDGDAAPRIAFTVPGLAVEGAKPLAGERFPLVVISHGYSGAPEAVTWLAENLASKGYVVAAIAHRDPPYGDPRGFAGPLLRRPVDIAFVVRALRDQARADKDPVAREIDPQRLALAGYSMGGYGVLTLAAGGFDPAGLPAKALPGAYLGPFLPGGARRDELVLPGLKAVVAISPFTGQPGLAAWSSQTLAAVRTPLLLIAGDRDHVVGFPGVRAVFDQALGAPRRLLVFENGDHSIGMNPAAEEAAMSLWGLDWFEDPVWRKDRILGVQLHMITAFLDLHVKGLADRAAYLSPAVPRSNDAVWPAAQAGAYGAYSPGAGGITVWKGFQRVHSAGLELWGAEPAP